MGLFGFGKKDQRDQATPSPAKDEVLRSRYQGRPLLLILDNYIADCLGTLAPDKSASIRAIVKKVFGGGDDWKQTVRQKLKLHESVDDSIRKAWSKFQIANPGVSPFAFAAAFSDRYFAPLIDATASDRGDRESDPSKQLEAQKRKERSLEILRQRNVPSIAHLPTIESVSTAKIRRPQEVARRAVVLSLVAAYAEPGSFSRDELNALLAERGVIDHLTPKEREFISMPNPTDSQRGQFTWRYEGVKTLLWALGHIDYLDYPGNICNVPETVRIIVQSDPSEFIENARLRDAREILDEADLIYRYDWACVNARVKKQPAPAGLYGGVVVERHHALNWLIGYGGQEWDEVSTDT